MENIFIKKLRESTGIRLAVLFGSFFFLMLIASMLSAIFGGSDELSKTHQLLESAMGCILTFCLPAYFVARFSSNDWAQWLHLTKAPSLKALAGVILIYIVSMPAMEWVIDWNNNIHLPQALSALETTLREWEETGAAVTQKLLSDQSIGEMIVGVLVIGVLTGFSEELFFRGGLQGTLARGGMKKDVAIWATAFIFSFMHFQFFGFVPRLIMGAFFGYLLVWTRCIWVPVFAHALNNSMVVVTAAITGEVNTDTSYFSDSWIYVAASVLLTSLILILGREGLFKNPQTLKEKWPKSQLPPVSGT